MSTRNIDDIRKGVLDKMEAANRRVQMLIILAALVEGLIITGALLLTNWKDPLHRLVLLVSTGTWTLLAVGFSVLGAHVTRVASRTVAALISNE
jgi:hypothetical protein